MDFAETEEHRLIRREIRDLCSEFGDEYWREKDLAHEFPHEFFETFADNDWCGLTIPEIYGGQGYGLQEAAIVQQELARSGAAQTGTSITAHHIFASAPLVTFGDEALKERYLPDVARGDVHMAVSVTEPNAGLDTSRIETTAERDGDEFVVDAPEAILQVRITSIEVGDQPRTEEARAEDVRTLWTRAVDNVRVPVSIHPNDGNRDQTRSVTMAVPGDEELTVGETRSAGDEKFEIVGIQVRADADGYRFEKFDHEGDMVFAKDVKRLYARDESSTAWSAW
jgi:uncharacterized Zn finger protein